MNFLAACASLRARADWGLTTMHTPNAMPKVRATLYLPWELLEEARNAAVHLAGNPVRLTLTKLAEEALRSQLQYLKERYNDGRDFPSELSS